jgi:outer membrane receptor protein involved in Fe transport
MTKSLFSFLLLISIAHAQEGRLKGKVEDIETASPIQYVNLNLSSSKAGFTNDLGLFYFDNIKPGNYELLVSHIGYKTEIIPVEIKRNRVSDISVHLKKTQLDLSEVKVGGKKPSPINTIGTIDIKFRPINTAQDILRIVPGIFIAQHAGGGKAEQIFLRGYDLDHGTDINISVDGMPVNMVSHAHGQGYSDLHFLIPETIEKISFNYGPYAAQYGNMATAGYVAFQTKDFIHDNSIKIEEGRFNTKRASAVIKVFDKENESIRQQFYMASEYFLSDSYFESPQNFHRFNLMAKYTVLFKGQTQLALIASHFNSKWNASGQIPERAVINGLNRFGSLDDTEGGNTERTNLSALFKKQWENGWKSSDQLYYTNYHFNLYSNFTFFLKDPINGDQINQKENRTIYGYNGSLTKSWNKTNTEIGYGIRYDDIKNIELNHSIQRNYLNTVQKGKIREGNSYLYAQQNLQLNNWHFTAGLRSDHLIFSYANHLIGQTEFKKQKRSTLNPKLNIAYTVNNNMQVFVSTGSGFHSNDSRVILQKEMQEILPKVYSIDAGIIVKPTKNILLKATLWKSVSETEFVYVGDEGIIEPGGRSMRSGIDLSLRYQLAKWLFADIDANLARPRSIDAPKGENYIPLAPLFSSIGGITIKNKERLSGSLRYRYLQNRPADETGSSIAKGYFITDALINYRIKKWELFALVENLFNIKWKEAQFYTESKLQNESMPVSEMHFTPGAPLFFKTGFSLSF